jgi:hypothetical protein
MPTQLQFFDMAVSITPPSGHLEPLPVTLGPNWQPNDIRLMFVSASASAASGAETNVMLSLSPEPPTGFTATYARNPGAETHGVYSRRLAAGDVDTSVYWTKPAGWRHFMFSTITVRGHHPATNPTGGTLRATHVGADTFATISSVTVPAAGAMLFFLGNVPTPHTIPWPTWAVATGVPTGWTHLAATDKSGQDFYQYDTSPSLVVVGKTFTGSGSTGSVVFPTAQGAPAFSGLWAFLTPAPDASAAIVAA